MRLNGSLRVLALAGGLLLAVFLQAQAAATLLYGAVLWLIFRGNQWNLAPVRRDEAQREE